MGETFNNIKAETLEKAEGLEDLGLRLIAFET